MKDLTKYNYDDLVAKATELLKDKEGWGDAYQSSTGQTLIQLLADTTDNLHYLLERRSIEGFLHHAHLESSVIARASELGYRPFRATAHTGTLELKIKDQNGVISPPIYEVFIPKHTQLQFEDRTFHTTDVVMMTNTQLSVELPVREGKYVDQVFPISDLNEMNEIVIQDWKAIDEHSMEVRVGSVEWKDVRHDEDVNKRALSFLGKNDKMYDVKYTTEGMHIVFGDGWFGAVPTDDITVSYMLVEDKPVIYTVGKTFTKSGGIKDNYDQTIIYDAVITNITPIDGGHAQESIDSIRKNVTIYNQTNGRGVTNSDYEFWARKADIGGILDVNAYGEEEIDTYVYNANNVYITYANATLTPLATTERAALRKYLDNIKTTQAHLVINPATKYHLVANASVRKYANVPTADSHTYYLVHEFLKEKFKIKPGAIGATFHNSDIINDFYGIRYMDNNVSKPLVDFVKWDMKVGIEYSFPSSVRSAMIGINPKRFESLPVGSDWVVILDGIICKITITADDTPATVLLRMRDVIRRLTDIEVGVILEGAAIDDNGNLTPIEVDPLIGYHLLIGKNSSNRDINDIINPAPVGSVVAVPRLHVENFSITHYYYNPAAGFRPTIPMRDTTTVTYETPTDTDVEVWIKPSYEGAEPFVLYKTIPAGTVFKESFATKQLLKFKLLNNSTTDTTVDIEYSSWNGAKIGLNLHHINMQSFFTVDVTAGALGDDAFVDYHLMATRPPEKIHKGERMIYPSTVVIYDEDGVEVDRDDGNGKFEKGGSVDYLSGIINPPSITHDGKKYMVTYKQDEYNNISLGRGDVLKLSEIPDEMDGDVTYGSIKIV